MHTHLCVCVYVSYKFVCECVHTNRCANDHDKVYRGGTQVYTHDHVHSVREHVRCDMSCVFFFVCIPSPVPKPPQAKFNHLKYEK